MKNEIMLQNQIILSGLTVEELSEIISQSIHKVFNSTDQGSKKIIEPEERFLTRMEAAKLLSVTLPTLHDYTKRGLLISYKIGKRVLYKYNEVLNALVGRNFFDKRGGLHAA